MLLPVLFCYIAHVKTSRPESLLAAYFTHALWDLSVLSVLGAHFFLLKASGGAMLLDGYK